jgi:general secretion pathway protein G
LTKATEQHGTTRNRWHSSSGFTLIELLIVIALISILATMGVVQYRNSVQSAKEATLRTDLFRMRDAIDQYYADKAKYPASLDALVSDGYMRAIPQDPITKSTDTWQTVPAEPEPGNTATDPGIYNIKSGASGTGLDGTSYSDW